MLNEYEIVPFMHQSWDVLINQKSESRFFSRSQRTKKKQQLPRPPLKDIINLNTNYLLAKVLFDLGGILRELSLGAI